MTSTTLAGKMEIMHISNLFWYLTGYIYYLSQACLKKSQMRCLYKTSTYVRYLLYTATLVVQGLPIPIIGNIMYVTTLS